MKRILPLALLLLLLVPTWASAAEDSYPEISYPELRAAVQAGKVTLIDCNAPDFYVRQGHLPGAISFEPNRAKLPGLLPKSRSALVVSYCMNHH